MMRHRPEKLTELPSSYVVDIDVDHKFIEGETWIPLDGPDGASSEDACVLMHSKAIEKTIVLIISSEYGIPLCWWLTDHPQFAKIQKSDIGYSALKQIGFTHRLQYNYKALVKR